MPGDGKQVPTQVYHHEIAKPSGHEEDAQSFQRKNKSLTKNRDNGLPQKHGGAERQWELPSSHERKVSSVAKHKPSQIIHQVQWLSGHVQIRHISQEILLPCTHSREATGGCTPLKQGNKPRKRKSQNSVNGKSGPGDRRRAASGQWRCGASAKPGTHGRAEGIGASLFDVIKPQNLSYLSCPWAFLLAGVRFTQLHSAGLVSRPRSGFRSSLCFLVLLEPSAVKP